MTPAHATDRGFPRAPVSDAPRVDDAVRDAADAARARGERLVLAVSGGRDSMTLLEATLRLAPEVVAAVAVFDHGTGPAAAAAAGHVAAECARVGAPAVTGRAELRGGSEAEWRAARWRFLRGVARASGARVATAHTRDDNVETILMRTIRGAGARGLAALYAQGDVVRPFLELSRDEVARAAAQRGVRWIDDPSNASRAFFRNRVRHEILPALRTARPAIDEELLAIARRAAALRRELASVVDGMDVREEDGALVVAAAALAHYDPESLRFLWGELASRAGVVLDARGIAGLARFTNGAATGDTMQLSGAVQVIRRRVAIVLAPRARDAADGERGLPGEGSVDWGAWRFRSSGRRASRVPAGQGAWSAVLPPTGGLSVRAWRPGDRMRGAGDHAPRRVKRFLRDAGIVGPERVGWPVVLDGAEIVWIPGVRRSDAATVRSGRPGAVYVCERIERRREG